MITRFLGLLLISLALLAGSAEAVMALGTGGHETIATGELWTLLSGESLSDGGGLLGLFGRVVSVIPAWMVMLLMGLVMLAASRRKPVRRAVFKSSKRHRAEWR